MPVKNTSGSKLSYLLQITFKVFKERENIKEDKGRSNNLHLLCLALNNLLRDLKEALCNQRQMSVDLKLDFPCASAVDRVGLVLLGALRLDAH